METYQFELVEVFYIPSLIELYLLTYIIWSVTHASIENNFLVILNGGFQIFVSSPKVQNVSNVAGS